MGAQKDPQTMISLFRSANGPRWTSAVRHASKTHAGVEYVIARMSLSRRTALLEAVHNVLQELKFRESGSDEDSQLRAGILRLTLQRIYLQWGLLAVRNLTIDGLEATPELVVQAGPEDLCEEIFAAIRAECGLSPTERKNS